MLTKMKIIRNDVLTRNKHRSKIIPIPVNAINTIKDPEYLKWKTKYEELRKPTNLR